MPTKNLPCGNSPERRAYNRARYRCRQTEGHFYKYYKSKGIEFKFVSFEEFFNEISWMPNYSEKWQLDRIDNERSYEVGNIRWATREQNSNNRSSNFKIYYEDRLYSLKELCNLKSLKYCLVIARLKRGWTLKQAIEKPIIPPKDKSQNVNINKKGVRFVKSTLRSFTYDNSKTND